MDIFQEIKNRAINYQEILDSCQIKLKSDAPHISVIVPVYGRAEFNKVLCNHIYNAIQVFDKTVAPAIATFPFLVRKPMISLTIVEHSDKPEHNIICDDWVNYVWIPKKGQPFNKCLAHNIGALLTKNANYFLFHDVDIMVPEDFFVKVMQNVTQIINGKPNLPSYDALQTFTQRRLQLCNEWLTAELISNHLSVKHIPSHPAHFKAAQPGAMGGSIFLTNELFFKTTFCAQTFTDYGLEDAFFWQCINLLGRVGSCDQPLIESYHLHHEATRITKPADWTFYNTFLALPDEKKKELVKLMADNLNKYRNETKD
jgi:predicted glycosyltransferase involved in capsule biosynthesis